MPFYLIRARGKNLRLVSVLESSRGSGRCERSGSRAAPIEVETAAGVDRHAATVEGWEVQTGDRDAEAGRRSQGSGAIRATGAQDRPLVATGSRLQVLEPPALDGTLEGFDPAEPLQLDHEDQYRRSEEPYAGPEEFSASATVNWNDEAALSGGGRGQARGHSP